MQPDLGPVPPESGQGGASTDDAPRPLCFVPLPAKPWLCIDYYGADMGCLRCEPERRRRKS